MYSVVVPLHNEEGNIESLVQEIHSVFSEVIHQPYELVLVDDASQDATAESVRSLKARYPAIKLLHHSKQAGQSRALKSGIEHAAHEVIITLDGDGQNNPADIPVLLQGFKEQGARGLVIGHREKRQDTFMKRLSSRVAFKARQFLLKDGAPDSGCGLKVFPKTLFLAMPFFNHIHRYFPVLTRRMGEPVLSVPISHRARGAGRSNYGTLDRLLVAIRDIFGVRWLLSRYDPEVKIHVL